jgi:hypothetical protein
MMPPQRSDSAQGLAYNARSRQERGGGGIRTTQELIDCWLPIDWDAAITALHAGELPCSGGERRVLELSSSVAGGTLVNLSDAVTGLDDGNINRLVTTILHASGKRTENSQY